MSCAKYRHSITIQKATESRSATGAVTVVWSTFAPLRAQKLTSGGREFYAAQKINAETSVLFVCRHYPGVLPKMRVNDGTIYDILSVTDPDGRGREMHISCKAVV